MDRAQAEMCLQRLGVAPRILIFDSAFNGRALRRALTGITAGCTAREVASTDELHAQAKGWLPHLLLVHANSPVAEQGALNADGVRALELYIRILIYSSDLENEGVQAALRRDFQVYDTFEVTRRVPEDLALATLGAEIDRLRSRRPQFPEATDLGRERARGLAKVRLVSLEQDLELCGATLALEAAGGCQRKAAKLAGVARSTLRGYLTKHGLGKPS